MSRRGVVVGIVCLLSVCGALASVSALRLRADLGAADPRGATQLFVVDPGAPFGRIARELETKGLIRDARAFSWLARWRDDERKVRAGEYEVSPAWESSRILEALVAGDVRTLSVSIPEGLRATQIAERIVEAGLGEADAILAIVADPESPTRFGVEGTTLEGYLFPETYRWPTGLSADDIVKTLVDQFHAVWRELEPEATRQGRSMREVVTLASIIEKETGAAEERPLIASVFLNRIARGMRLESDPTTIYGIPNFDGNLRRVHLEDEANPYNTYRIPGLTPTPIANPGAAALRAVLWPKESKYLFFVARGDGTHEFAGTYAEHNANVDRYQRRRRRR